MARSPEAFSFRREEKPYFSSSSYLVVQHHHVARVSAQPRVDGLAHAADLVQRRSVMVGPAKLHHLRRARRQKEEEEKEEGVRGPARVNSIDTKVNNGIGSILV